MVNKTKPNNQRNQIKDPMLYKTGKKRLGPLNLEQLKKLLDAATKPKEKARIRNRITIVESRISMVAPVVEASLI